MRSVFPHVHVTSDAEYAAGVYRRKRVCAAEAIKPHQTSLRVNRLRRSGTYSFPLAYTACADPYTYVRVIPAARNFRCCAHRRASRSALKIYPSVASDYLFIRTWLWGDYHTLHGHLCAAVWLSLSRLYITYIVHWRNSCRAKIPAYAILMKMYL